MKLRIKLQKSNWLDEKALGYVESLIAIAISGILMVGVALLASRVLRSTVENDLQDAATQQTIMYMDIVRAIKDDGWGTESGEFPNLLSYDICFESETAQYYLCEEGDSNTFTIDDDTFERTVTVTKRDNLAIVKVELKCREGKCKNISNTQSQALSIKSDSLDSNSNLDEGAAEGTNSGQTNNALCGNSRLDTGETCDYGGQLPEVCSSCQWRCPYGGTLSGSRCSYLGGTYTVARSTIDPHMGSVTITQASRNIRLIRSILDYYSGGNNSAF